MFTINQSDKTHIHPRVELGCDPGGLFQKRKFFLVPENSRRESGKRLTDCKWKAVEIQRNDLWYLEVKCDEHNHDPRTTLLDIEFPAPERRST